jgi:phage shock protein B
MEDILIPLIVVPILFIGLPWLIFHYITKWKQAKTLTEGDEKLLDDLHEVGRRLDDRLCTIERIMTAENPNWRQQCLPGREERLLPEESKHGVR